MDRLMIDLSSVWTCDLEFGWIAQFSNKSEQISYLADSGYSRVNIFTAVYILNSRFPEKEVNIITNIVGTNEMRLYNDNKYLRRGQIIM